MNRIFLLMSFFQVANASLLQNPELKDLDPFERQIQDRFADMLNVRLSLHASTTDRNEYLKGIASRLRFAANDQVKQSVCKLEVLKEVMSAIDHSCAVNQLSTQAMHFLSHGNWSHLEKKDVPACASECTAYLIDYLKNMHQENVRVKNDNDVLRKALAELEKKYNRTFIKSLFDCVNDKRIMRFFCATMGLIILVGAAASWNLDHLEHMLLTFVGFTGFFALGVTPFF